MPDGSKQHSGWQSIAGTLTAIAAIITVITGLVAALRHDDTPKPSSAAPPVATTSPGQTQPGPSQLVTMPVQPRIQQFSLSGLWRDNWGTLTAMAQYPDNSFGFSAKGLSCQGTQFKSTGTGTLDGNKVKSNYQSDLPSRGTCSGIVSPDGTQITSTCEDSMCGRSVSSSVRQ